jgi:hypothetical protein
MSQPENDLGILAVLLKRFETERLPAILSMKKTVEAGETLSDGDIEYLHRVLEEIRVNRLGPLLERHPEYRDLAAAVFSNYRHIVERDLENEKRGRKRPPA